jgi:hypothetical protein
MAAKLTRLTHKIAIQLHLVAESCTICTTRSRRPVRKLLDTPSYASVTAMRDAPTRTQMRTQFTPPESCLRLGNNADSCRWISALGTPTTKNFMTQRCSPLSSCLNNNIYNRMLKGILSPIDVGCIRHRISGTVIPFQVQQYKNAVPELTAVRNSR